MTPAIYRDVIASLGLTHEEAARLLAIHPVTSRKSKVNETTVRLLTLIEYLGVERVRRIFATRGREDEYWIGLDKRS